MAETACRSQPNHCRGCECTDDAMRYTRNVAARQNSRAEKYRFRVFVPSPTTFWRHVHVWHAVCQGREPNWSCSANQAKGIEMNRARQLSRSFTTATTCSETGSSHANRSRMRRQRRPAGHRPAACRCRCHAPAVCRTAQRRSSTEPTSRHVHDTESGNGFDWISGASLLLLVGTSIGFTLFVGKALCGQFLSADPMLLLGALGG